MTTISRETFVCGGNSARFLVAALLAIGEFAGGCAKDKPPGSQGGDNASAAIVVALTLAKGVTVDTVTYTLTGAAGNTVQSGSISVRNSESIEFQLANVLPGAGYTISTTTTGTGVTCSGSADPFTVSSRMTTNVQIAMACYAAGGDAGMVAVTGVPFLCGTWNSLSTVGTGDQVTNGSEANVGSSITLTATATGPDPSKLTYTWSSSSSIGTFGSDQPNGTSDTIAFLCTEPGTTTITLVVGDGPVPDGASCSAAQNTATAVVTCDAPAATFDRVSFAVTTGDSALTKESAAMITLQPQTGPAQTFTVKAAGDPAWGTNTTHAAAFNLKPALQACDVVNATVTFNSGSTDIEGSPAWSLTSLTATLSIDESDQVTFVSASGSPLAELTANTPTFKVPATCNNTPSLYARLGGQPAMNAVGKNFVNRIIADSRLTRIVSAELSTPDLAAAAATWIATEMCKLGGGGCLVQGTSPFAGATTTSEALALIRDLADSLATLPPPATLNDENELLGSPLIVDQHPMPIPLLPNGQPDPIAFVGGAIGSPRYFTLYWDASWDADNPAFPRAALDSFSTAVSASTYFGGLSEYGVGQPMFLGSALPNVACTRKAPSPVGFYDPSNPSIIGFLHCELDNDTSLPQGNNVIYNVVLPQGSTEADAIAQLFGVPADCTGPGSAAAWHFHGTPYNLGSVIGGLIGGALGLSVGSPTIGAVAGFLVALATQGGPFYTISSVDTNCGDYTGSLVHEMVEAASDPEPGVNVITSGGTGEIADMCESIGGSMSWVPTSATSSLSPSVFLGSSLPQYWSNAAQSCGTGFSDTTVPSINNVTVSGTAFPQTLITISGLGFGTVPSPFTIPSGSDLPYLGVQDVNQGWQAGNSFNSDATSLSVTSWTNTSITIGGFNPPPGGSIVLNAGDSLVVWACNPSSGACASSTIASPVGQNCGRVGQMCCPANYCSDAGSGCDSSNNCVSCPTIVAPTLRADLNLTDGHNFSGVNNPHTVGGPCDPGFTRVSFETTVVATSSGSSCTPNWVSNDIHDCTVNVQYVTPGDISKSITCDTQVFETNAPPGTLLSPITRSDLTQFDGNNLGGVHNIHMIGGLCDPGFTRTAFQTTPVSGNGGTCTPAWATNNVHDCTVAVTYDTPADITKGITCETKVFETNISPPAGCQ